MSNNNNENDPTDFGAFLEHQIASSPELSVSFAEAEKELEAEAKLADAWYVCQWILQGARIGSYEFPENILVLANRVVDAR